MFAVTIRSWYLGDEQTRMRTAADLVELDGERYVRLQAGTGKGKSQIGIRIGK